MTGNLDSDRLQYGAALGQRGQKYRRRANKAALYNIHDFLTQIGFGSSEGRTHIAEQLLNRWGGSTAPGRPQMLLLLRVQILEDLLNYVSVSGWPQRQKYEIGSLLVAWFPSEGHRLWGKTLELRELYLKSLGNMELSRRKLAAETSPSGPANDWSHIKKKPFKNPGQQVLWGH